MCRVGRPKDVRVGDAFKESKLFEVTGDSAGVRIIMIDDDDGNDNMII